MKGKRDLSHKVLTWVLPFTQTLRHWLLQPKVISKNKTFKSMTYEYQDA